MSSNRRTAAMRTALAAALALGMTACWSSTPTVSPSASDVPAPTPTSVGPACVPCALRPWHVAQFARNNERPSATASAVGACACADFGASNE